jgi:hypothetical protein
MNDLPLVFADYRLAKDFIKPMSESLQNIIIKRTNLIPWKALKYEGEVFMVESLITL